MTFTTTDFFGSQQLTTNSFLASPALPEAGRGKDGHFVLSLPVDKVSLSLVLGR